MPPVNARLLRMDFRTPFDPTWQQDHAATEIQPWTPGPVAQAAMNLCAEEPEMAVAALAFLVGLLCPCRERVCEKIIVACCDHRIARAKKEKAKP